MFTISSGYSPPGDRRLVLAFSVQRYLLALRDLSTGWEVEVKKSLPELHHLAAAGLGEGVLAANSQGFTTSRLQAARDRRDLNQDTHFVEVRL